MRGDLGRIHGSVGVAIAKPSLVLRASTAPELRAEGPRASRVMEFARGIMEHAGVEAGVEFELISDIPEHVGFGSGTQLALAVGTAISELHGLGLGVEEMAAMLGRSRVSGVGVHAFKHGGFIVDGGHRVDEPESVPPMIFRAEVPDDWLFVIGVPDIDQGISGGAERDAFRRLGPPPEELVGGVARVVLMQMIPAILEGDIEAFGGAMTALDYRFGEYWLEVQGGRFSHRVIEEGVEFLLGAGAYGAGQSSWGPAFYGLARGEGQASELSDRLGGFLNGDGRSGRAFHTGPDNGGAEVTVTG